MARNRTALSINPSVAALGAPSQSSPQPATPQTPPNPNTSSSRPKPDGLGLKPIAPDNPLVQDTDPLLTPPVVYDWDGKPAAASASGNSSGPDNGSGQKPAQKKKPLQFFLYDFFAPAREIIDARRAAIVSEYAPPASQTQPVSQTGQSATPYGQFLPQGGRPDTQSVPSEQTSTQSAVAGADANTEDADSHSLLNTPDNPAQPRRLNQRRMVPDPAPADSLPTAGDVVRPEEAPAIDGFEDVADPLLQLSRNVTTSIPDNYQLEPGDSLTVRYWSPTRAPQTFAATLDPQGAIVLEGGRRAVLRGQTIAGAENLLRVQLGHLYRQVDVSVTLKELRTISVTVSGEAYAPGTYIVPSVATAFNVLYSAGGPTQDGSLRQIEIHRNGKLIGRLDIYKFVTTGSTAGDIRMQPGDILYIPPRVSQVTVDGEVRHPAIFELLESENLGDALGYAGGVKPSGVDQRLQISTLDPGAARVLKDVDLKDTHSAKLPLYDGDSVEVFSVRDTLMNRVTIDGDVDQPGDYALEPGMRVSDLISRARGVLDTAFVTRADLFRWNPDTIPTLVPIDLSRALAGDPAADFALCRWDRLRIYSRDEVAWIGRRQIEVRGSVQRPGIYVCSDNLHVSDLLRMAGGLTPDAYRDRAILLHRHGDGTYAYSFVKLDGALTGDPSQDMALTDGDVLAVYNVSEAHFTPEQTVTIEGDVLAPGTYPCGASMRLSDVLAVAGGLRPGASRQISVAHARRIPNDDAPEVATIAVTTTASGECSVDGDPVMQDGDVVTVQGTGGYNDKVRVVTVNGAVNRPGPVVIDGSMRLSDAIREAGGLQPEAYPSGAQFFRSPDQLATAGQSSMAILISHLNDMLNQDAYQRAQAVSDVERIKASTGGGPSQSSLLSSLTGGSAPAPAASAPASAALAASLDARDLVSAPRQLGQADLMADGNVAVDLDRAIANPGGREDIPLIDGDVITVPEKPTTVQVVGAVIEPRAVLFHSDAPLSYYIANAGGFAVDAAQDRIVVIHIGGGLIPASKVRSLQPGDVVLVPTKVMADKLAADHTNAMDDFFKNITNSAIAFKLASALFSL